MSGSRATVLLAVLLIAAVVAVALIGSRLLGREADVPTVGETSAAATLPPGTPLPAAEASPLAPTPAITMEPLALVKAYEDAQNRYDVEGFVELFTDPMEFRFDRSSPPITTKKDLRSYPIPYNLGLQAQSQITNCQVDGDTITCTQSILNDCRPGTPQVGTLTLTVENGRIRKASLLQSTDVLREATLELAAMGKWALEHDVAGWARVDELTQRGYWVRATGAALLGVCRAYHGIATPAPRELTEEETAAIEALELMLNMRARELAEAVLVDDNLFFAWFTTLTTSRREHVQDWLDYLVQRQAEFAISECRAGGDTIDCTLEWRDESVQCFMGLDVLYYDLAVKLRGGQVQMFDLSHRTEGLKAMMLNGPTFGAWAAANMPEPWQKYRSLLATGYPNGEAGQLEMQLCKAYRASLGQK